MKFQHPDREVTEAFRKLQDALVSWERSTGRDSLLIFREVPGHVTEHGPMNSDVVIRLSNGVPTDPACADLSDEHLLRGFSAKTSS